LLIFCTALFAVQIAEDQHISYEIVILKYVFMSIESGLLL